MGIVVAAADDASRGAALFIVLAAWLAVAAGLTIHLGLPHVGHLLSPPRVPRDPPIWPLATVTAAAVLTWQAIVPVIYFAAREALGRPVSTTQPDIPPADLIALGVAGPILATIVTLIGDAGVRPRVKQDLGLGVRRLGPGLAVGLLGAFIAIPLVMWTAQIAEVIYQAMNLRHPAEHELLRFMRDLPTPLARFGAIAAAVIVAPLWEELLFRGHVQTLIRTGLARLRTPERPTTGPAWTAIVVTSVLFALVHPAWTWPPIFVLSVGLGYAYERTNNLWAPIFMHAAFNGLSTWFYLTFGAGN